VFLFNTEKHEHQNKIGPRAGSLRLPNNKPRKRAHLTYYRDKSEILLVLSLSLSLSLSPVVVDKGAKTKTAEEVGLCREQERNGNPIIILFSTPFKTQKSFTNWPFFKSVKYIQITRFLN